MLGYGMASSFDGATRLEKFTADYHKLIDGILALNPQTRSILLCPIRHPAAAGLPPLPDPVRHNPAAAGLASYMKAIGMHSTAGLFATLEKVV